MDIIELLKWNSLPLDVVHSIIEWYCYFHFIENPPFLTGNVLDLYNGDFLKSYEGIATRYNARCKAIANRVVPRRVEWLELPTHEIVFASQQGPAHFLFQIYDEHLLPLRYATIETSECRCLAHCHGLILFASGGIIFSLHPITFDKKIFVRLGTMIFNCVTHNDYVFLSTLNHYHIYKNQSFICYLDFAANEYRYGFGRGTILRYDGASFEEWNLETQQFETFFKPSKAFGFSPYPTTFKCLSDGNILIQRSNKLYLCQVKRQVTTLIREDVYTLNVLPKAGLIFLEK